MGKISALNLSPYFVWKEGKVVIIKILVTFV